MKSRNASGLGWCLLLRSPCLVTADWRFFDVCLPCWRDGPCGLGGALCGGELRLVMLCGVKRGCCSVSAGLAAKEVSCCCSCGWSVFCRSRFNFSISLRSALFSLRSAVLAAIRIRPLGFELDGDFVVLFLCLLLGGELLWRSVFELCADRDVKVSLVVLPKFLSRLRRR